MRRALRLAARARGRTSPNPMVGAVIVKNGKIIAEDYHKRPGEPHAEALAIARSGELAKGSTLYVTLEPCRHLDKRTPPCTKAIMESGIERVFVAMKDPNPKVSGKGIDELRNNNIEVIDGVLEDEAKRLNEAYIKYITTSTPFVILKVAMTLDGKIATPEGQSKWITGEKARRLVHRMRSSVDAILTAIGTVKTDNPELTARMATEVRDSGNPIWNPKRIVIDPDLETPATYKIFNIPPETIVVMKKVNGGARTGESVEIKKSLLQDKGIKFIEFEEDKADLRWLMSRLGEMGITSVMVEGGSSLNSYALNAGIVDKVMFFVSLKIIGGKHSYPAVGGKTFRRLDEAHSLKDVKVKWLEDDLLIEGYL